MRKCHQIKHMDVAAAFYFLFCVYLFLHHFELHIKFAKGWHTLL